jgi:hypothetical protein
VPLLRGLFTGRSCKRLWQKLFVGNLVQISAANCAEFNLPFLGEWRSPADGVWGADEQVAKVSFEAFSLQATKHNEIWALCVASQPQR